MQPPKTTEEVIKAAPDAGSAAAQVADPSSDVGADTPDPKPSGGGMPVPYTDQEDA